MQTDPLFTGALVIAPTPFEDDGSLDLDSINTLVEFYVEKGVHGLTTLGVFGEAHKLLFDERARVIEAYISATDGRLPVYVGATHAATTPAVALARQAQELGGAGLLIGPPPLSGGNTEDLVRAHFQAISDAVSIPIMVQDYPPSSGGLKMSPELLAKMGETIEQVRYLKLEDPPTPLKVNQVRQVAGDNLGIVGGLGGLFFFEELEQGAQGTMTGFAYPEILVDVYTHHAAGDVERAADIFYRYLPLIRFEFQPGIALAVRKEIYRRRGLLKSATARAPSALLDPGTARELTNLLARLELS
jgi:4-hydroxy-tetrahydrodipicolinate synthase